MKVAGQTDQLASIDADGPDFLAIRETEAWLWERAKKGNAKISNALMRGDQVLIPSPGVDLRARCERADAGRRIECLMELLGRQVLVTVHPRQVAQQTAHGFAESYVGSPQQR